MKHNPWITLNSKIVYQNPWIKIREDKVTCPDGNPGIYGVVETVNATGVVALNDKNEIYLVGQYRYPINTYSWEIIEGGGKPGETPLQTIQRELIEEAGLIAEEWTILGNIVHTSNCISDEKAYLYLARGLTEVPRQPDHTEILDVKVVPFSEALSMVHEGEIQDAMSIISILRAERFLR
jgi:ADP-ribose pyrophosphatase